MDIKQAFRLAVKSLLGSKMRSFLTMLGIIIGVGSVIVLVSLVNGMSQDMVSTFESMGTNLISVTVMGRGGNRTVTPDEMQTLVDENPDTIGAMSPSISISGATVKYSSDNVTASCVGVNEFYGEVNNAAVAEGRAIAYMDVEQRARNCVIGTYLVNELFAGADPLGETIRINGESFQVVGVLEETQGGEEGSEDATVLIPYTVAQRLSQTFMVSSYSFSAKNKDTVDAAMDIIDSFLLQKFSSSDAYRVFNQADALTQVNELTGTMTLVLVGVAGISLLVGGIGIMNIMLVSVTERTREIGVRKSLGATPWDILSQFVVEAITTSSVGGIIGILFGIAAAYLAAALMQMSVAISLPAILIAFSVSAIIGVTFGFFPARKASKLNPIEALRYD